MKIQESILQDITAEFESSVLWQSQFLSRRLNKALIKEQNTPSRTRLLRLNFPPLVSNGNNPSSKATRRIP
jgi:hypothetical protein